MKKYMIWPPSNKGIGKRLNNPTNNEITINELMKNRDTILKLLFFKKPDFLNFLIINYCIATTSFTSGK